MSGTRKRPPTRGGRPTSRKRRKAPKRKAGLLTRLARLIRGIFGAIWVFATRSLVVMALIIGFAVFLQYQNLPDYKALLDGRARGSVTMLDRNGNPFAWRGEQYSKVLDANSVAPVLKNAVIATEDKRFKWHPGVDPQGIASAIRINLREGRGPLSGHGGSTITQQTAKLLCMGRPFNPEEGLTENEYEAECRRTTLWRKATEAIYAMAMELKYSKDEILTIYMNRSYLGSGARGFDAASQRYFGKSAADVSLSEAAMLAGLLKAPSTYAPTANLERSQGRAEVIIGLMEEQGYITAQEATEARANPAQLSRSARSKLGGGYFADWVMDQAPAFLTSETTEDVVIATTFDPRIQHHTERALAHIFETKVRPGSKAQAAIVVMDADGAVRAMVGGRETRGIAGQFNRAIQAKRQTGSAFKPFVYATALDLGGHPNSTVVDEPITLRGWTPRNYSRNYYGRVTYTQALSRSLNAATVALSEQVGRDKVRKVAADFGIKSELDEGPALALGTSEATLLETTGAYAGILNGGTAVTPYGIRELRLDRDPTPLMTKQSGLRERVISERAARELTYMMHRVIEEGTGQRAKLADRQAAGKTGTTSSARDAWFIGFTRQYVTGVWMGYDDNTPLTGVTGGGLPAEIWHEVSARVHEGLKAWPLQMASAPAAPQPAQPARPVNPNAGSKAEAKSSGSAWVNPNVAPPQGQSGQGNRSATDDAIERVLTDVLNSILSGN